MTSKGKKQVPSLRCGMTSKGAGNGEGEVRGFFAALRMTSKGAGKGKGEMRGFFAALRLTNKEDAGSLRE